MVEFPIRRINITFIWTRTFFHFLKGKQSVPYKFAFLSGFSTYKQKFEQIKRDRTDEHGLTLPWERRFPNNFWKYYFKGKEPRDASPNSARNNLVPFRTTSKTHRITSPDLGKQEFVKVEGYFYPHGVAAVATLCLLDSASLTEMVERALRARRNWSYQIGKGDEAPIVSFGGMGNFFLDLFTAQALGKKEAGLDFPGDPFSIVTVKEGSGDYRGLAVEQGNVIHQALEKLSTWNTSWPGTNPPRLEDHKFLIKNEFNNHYLYGSDRGRVVWFPQYFAPPDNIGKIYALRWYHRNLVHASLQTFSLGAFLWHTARKAEETNLTGYQIQAARDAIKVLEKLYQASDNTYQTWNSHAMMEQVGFLDAINNLKTIGV